MKENERPIENEATRENELMITEELDKEGKEGLTVVTKRKVKNNKMFKKIVIIEGKFKNFEKMTVKEIRKISSMAKRYNEDKKREYIVTARLKLEHCTESKKTNAIKILR